VIISASGRTDIPAFYAKWFLNRVNAGYVCARNPFRPETVLRYRLDADVVDAVVFCTKNPAPMLGLLDGLAPLNPYFFVTITPYGRDIEPNVPDYHEVARSLVALSKALGARSVCWRYDPIILSDEYTAERHAASFSEICALLEGSVSECVVSFVQPYAKTARNFPDMRLASPDERHDLLAVMVPIAKLRGITVRTCADYAGTAIEGLGVPGCVTRRVLREFTGIEAPALPGGPKRPECRCDLPSRDIGAYNSCPHGCKYCYANYDAALAVRNYRAHDPDSELLIGHIGKDDIVVDAKQESYRQSQLSFGFSAI
jgi:hypothetical protein